MIMFKNILNIKKKGSLGTKLLHSSYLSIMTVWYRVCCVIWSQVDDPTTYASIFFNSRSNFFPFEVTEQRQVYHDLRNILFLSKRDMEE